MKSVRKNKQKRRSIFGGTKKSKSLSLTKEFEIIEKKNEKHTNYIWMNAFNKILNEMKKKIEKTKFINKHSFTQFLKVYKPYLKIKKIVEKLKAAGNSTMSVKMYTFEKNVIEGKFKKIEQQNKKKIVLDELKQKKPRVKSMLSLGSPNKKNAIVFIVREKNAIVLVVGEKNAIVLVVGEKNAKMVVVRI